ncbi:hypothetical protein [Glaciibacter sp. 2TAF33]|uniref:hypothetical protein n=1 Tax=Glaciibacter sp. 2TAF33 TaxID=3233015 RepID=UPI003F934383
MRVLLKETLNCHPDAAWRAVQSPAVFREVSSPVLTMESLEPRGFPTVWAGGEHPVVMRGLGLVPMGEQVISLTTTTTQDGDVRILRDAGRGVSGAMTVVTLWDHRMAISPDPAGTGKTLYRDQLIFTAGRASVAVWPAFWAFWQWRMLRLKQLAPSWQLDLGVDSPDWTPPMPTATGTGANTGLV